MCSVTTALLLAAGVATAESVSAGYQRLPVPKGASAAVVSYGSVSCPTATWCTATGASTTGGPIVLTESNGKWGTPTTISLPAGGKRGWLYVTCPSVGNCSAAGTYVAANGAYMPLVASESAGSWYAATSYALPSGATTGTSEWAYDATPWCASAGNCLIVGTFQTATCGQMSCGWGLLAIQETSGVLGVPTTLGLSWSHPIVPMLGCSSIGNCLVVAGPESIAEVGGTWQQPTGLPSPGNPASDFAPSGLGCTTAGTCVLVGELRFPSFWAAASVAWTGQTWGAIRPLPRPAHDPLLGDSEMDSISCHSARCVAVGRGGGHWCFTGPPCTKGGFYVPTAAIWAAGSWGATEIFRVPTPPRYVEPGGWLSTVSCATSAACVAVGQDGAFRSSSILQEIWPFSVRVKS